LKKKEVSVEIGTDYEHQRAKYYLTQKLKELFNNNEKDCILIFLQGLSPAESTDFPVEGDQETKTGQKTRNLGKKQRRKSTRFH
jgi:hypothetical protein